jgi:hypothetical protein
LAGLIQITLGHLPSFDPFSVLLALLFIYFGWRSFGTLLQEWFTTRPPSPSNWKAAFARRRINGKISGTATCDGFVRTALFNSGILLSGLGLLLTMSTLDWATRYILMQMAR